MKITSLLGGLLLIAAAGPALAEDMDLVPLTVQLPGAGRAPMQSSCEDCGLHYAEREAREREKRLVILTYNAVHGGPENWAELGYFYAREARPSDPVKALPWLTRAAKAGNVKAMNDLGMLYAEGGPGLTADPHQAEYWLNRAAEAGDLDAQSTLASYYGNGRVLPRDLVRAARWYIRAAESGGYYRITDAADFFDKNGDLDRGFDYRLRAWQEKRWNDDFLCRPDMRLSRDRRARAFMLCDANLGEPPRYEAVLADALIAGDPVPQNLPRAIAILKTGLDDGNPHAAAVMAGLYERGQGVSADPEQAARLYTYAARGRDASAQSWLAAHPEANAQSFSTFDFTSLPENEQAEIKAAVARAFTREAYPARALDDEVEGSATIDCQWSATGTLELCAVIEEGPAGYGFGAASVRLAARIVMPPLNVKTGAHSRLRLVWWLG